MKSPADCRLYAIVDLGYIQPEAVVEMTRALVKGGADLVQLRAKQHSESTILALGRAMLPITRAAGVPLIINDFPALVPQIGANGAHIGQDDGPIEIARQAAGPGAIIGRSTHSLEQARAAFAEGADYLGFGPLFPTPTKPDYTAIGLADIAKVVVESPVPVFCIGGIKTHNLCEVMNAGAKRVVIVSELLQSPDPAAAVREIKALIASHS